MPKKVLAVFMVRKRSYTIDCIYKYMGQNMQCATLFFNKIFSIDKVYTDILKASGGMFGSPR